MATLDGLKLLAASTMLILCATGQAIVFKSVAYAGLGPYPYFILITVSSAFVPIFFMMVMYIDCFSGGFQEAQTTLRFKKHFMVTQLRGQGQDHWSAQDCVSKSDACGMPPCVCCRQ